MGNWMIENEEVVPSPYRMLSDEESIGCEGHEAISLSRFLQWVESDSTGNIGVCIEPADNPDILLPYFDRISFIAIAFPSFTDGRGYSHARRLRKNHRFEGPIVSYGDVLRDQLMHMKRCGMSAYILREDQDPQGSLEVFSRFPQFYQKPL